MAQNSVFFGAAGGSSSWADDDDIDTAPIPLSASMPKVDEQEPEPRAESPRRDEPERRERTYSNERPRDRDESRRGRGGYEDRGAYRDEGRAPRGGYEGDRPKNPVPDQGPYKAFVGNLSFRVNEHDIVDFIGSPESITDVRVQRDPVTDRHKGFAYVEFRDRDALVDALKLDGEKFDGRVVRIDVATDKERKPRQRDNAFFDKRSDRPRRDEPRYDTPRERPRLSLAPRSSSNDDLTGSPKAKKVNPFGEAKPRDEAAFWERKKAEEAEAKAKAKAEAAAKKTTPRERKNSHDDTRGGRGGRGDRTERAGGRGRGPVTAPAKKEEAKPKAKAAEPKVPPKATKLPAPASTKTKNAFDLLGDDSDSD